jgi:hypothetical protein
MKRQLLNSLVLSLLFAGPFAGCAASSSNKSTRTEEVNTGIDAAKLQLDACAETAAKEAGAFDGSVEISCTVRPDGSVSDISATATNGVPASLADCAKGVFEGLNFGVGSADAGDVKVRKTFNFRAD